MKFVLTKGEKPRQRSTIDMLENYHCRYPVGLNKKDQHVFCGMLVKKGTSWCPEHYKRVFWLGTRRPLW